MKALLVKLSGLFFIIILTQACLGEYEDSYHDKQIAAELKALEKYISDSNITVSPTLSGLYFIDTEKGSGDSVLSGASVAINYVGYLLDGTMFDSNVDTMAVIGGIYSDDGIYEPYNFVVGVQGTIAGVQQGVAYMREGGKARLIFPSTLGYGPYWVGNVIPPYSSLIFDIHLLDVVNP